MMQNLIKLLKRLKLKNKIKQIYNVLLKSRGYLNWWPAFSVDEVIIGAILTQSVSWNNVEKAINLLKQNNLLTLNSLLTADKDFIAKLVYSTRYYNAKAEKLKAFCDFLNLNHNMSLDAFFALPIVELRKQLLSIKGIGEETADSIILYAAEKPIFVIDAYTKRIFSRLGYCKPDIKYIELQKMFMDILPADVKLFNDFHAQIVKHANTICKTKPKCDECVLAKQCKFKASLN